MEKLTLTRRQIFTIDQEIQTMQHEQQALALFHRKDIRRFYQAAEMQLKITKARFKELQEKYVQKDDAGNFMTKEVDGGATWVLMQAKVDITKAKTMDAAEIEKAFNTEGNKMFDQQVTIEWNY